MLGLYDRLTPLLSLNAALVALLLGAASNAQQAAPEPPLPAAPPPAPAYPPPAAPPTAPGPPPPAVPPVAPSPSAPVQATLPPQPANCQPPWYLDAQGHKVFRPECLPPGSAAIGHADTASSPTAPTAPVPAVPRAAPPAYPPSTGSYPPYSSAPYAGLGYATYGEYSIPPPRTLPYRPNEVPPDGYRRSTRIRRGFIIAGAVTFGSTWLLSTAIASASSDSMSSSDSLTLTPLYAPIVGPFIAIGTSDPAPMGTFALVVDGLAQSSGVALFIIGMTKKQQVWLRNDLGRVTLSPISVAAGTTGIGIIGEM